MQYERGFVNVVLPEAAIHDADCSIIRGGMTDIH